MCVLDSVGSANMLPLTSRLVSSRLANVTLPRRQLWWWGHDTLEDKEERVLSAQKKRVLKWTNPELGIEAKTRYLYAPTRIADEASITAPQGGGLATAWFQPLRSTLIPFFHDPGYMAQQKQVKIYNKLVKDQQFIYDRVATLGPDLSAAHFLCHRNCRVRFKGHDQWTDITNIGATLPSIYEPGWFIEAIDAAETELVYEGFQNLRNLVFLKHLDLSYSLFTDAWVMDRISGEYADSLEYLDISGCPELNANALECIWRLRHLKVCVCGYCRHGALLTCMNSAFQTLVLYDLDHIKDLPLICLMILDIMPNLTIQGVEYIDPTLLKGTEHEHLLEDLDELRVLPIEAGAESPRPSQEESLEHVQSEGKQ